MLQFVAQPPVASVLKKIIRMRGGAETMPVESPKQPCRRCRRPTPRRVHQRRWIPPKITGEKAGKSGAQHVLPKINPRRGPSREKTMHHLM